MVTCITICVCSYIWELSVNIFIQSIKGTAKKSQAEEEEWRSRDVEYRLEYSLVKVSQQIL